jgi:chemotaxis response regulator CheB
MLIKVIKDGDVREAGCVQLARINDHVKQVARQRLVYAQQPADHPYRSAVGVFLDCVARGWSADPTGDVAQPAGLETVIMIIPIAQGIFTGASDYLVKLLDRQERLA